MRILLVILLIFSSNVFAIGLDDIFDPITDTTKNIYNKTKEFFNLDKCSSSDNQSTWTDCVASKKYYNGNSYEGEWLNGREHGNGIYTYTIPYTYKSFLVTSFKGNWTNGFRHGVGHYTTKNNTIIEVAYKNGTLYQGDFVRVYYPDDTHYFGYMNSQGQYHGTGELKIDEFIYKGEFERNSFTGKGSIHSQDGSAIFGSFQDAKAIDITKIYYSNGDKYFGDTRDLIAHGKGSLYLNDSSVFIGTFVNGRLQGFGEAKYSDGTSYKGEWKNGLFHGEGIRKLKGYTQSGLWSKGTLSKSYSSKYFKDTFIDQNQTYKTTNVYSFFKKNLVMKLFLFLLIFFTLRSMYQAWRNSIVMVDNSNKPNYKKTNSTKKLENFQLSPNVNDKTEKKEKNKGLLDIKKPTPDNKKESGNKDKLDFDL